MDYDNIDPDNTITHGTIEQTFEFDDLNEWENTNIIRDNITRDNVKQYFPNAWVESSIIPFKPMLVVDNINDPKET